MSRPVKKAKVDVSADEQRKDSERLAAASQYARTDFNQDVTSTVKGKNKKLTSHLATLKKSHRANTLAAYEHDTLLLPSDNAGLLEAEDDVERTWRIGQAEIKSQIGVEAASKGFDLDLDHFGPYALDYTANGRHLALGGRRGHVATFDWQTGQLHTELNLNETIRDISWLHDQSFFAVAQKKYVYIYDRQGIEIHQLRSHIEVNKMTFLRYHFLLATIGNAGYLKYQDTSTGTMVCEHKTKLGSCDTMAQNPHTAIINLGHANGTVTLWSPNMSTPHVKLLAHQGPVKAIAIDQGSTLGHYMATTGMDGRLKLWDARKWEVVNEWSTPKPASSLAFSQKGLLGVGWGNHVSVYKDVFNAQNYRSGPYMTNPFPSRPVQDLAFCPFNDILGVGHSAGFSSLIIPGSGEANFDSLEADPYENKRSRQEREINALLDKIQPDQITMDRDFIGKIARADPKNPTRGVGEAASKQKEKGIGPRQDQTPFRKLSRGDRLIAKGQADPATLFQSEEGDDNLDLQGVETRPGKKLNLENRRVVGKNKERKRVMRKRADIIDAKTEAVKARNEERKQQAIKRREAASTAVQESAGDSSGGALARFGNKKR